MNLDAITSGQKLADGHNGKTIVAFVQFGSTNSVAPSKQWVYEVLPADSSLLYVLEEEIDSCCLRITKSREKPL